MPAALLIERYLSEESALLSFVGEVAATTPEPTEIENDVIFASISGSSALSLWPVSTRYPLVHSHDQDQVQMVETRPVVMAEEALRGWPSWDDYRLYLASCVAGLTWKGVGVAIAAGLTWFLGEFNPVFQVLCGLVVIRVWACGNLSFRKKHAENLRGTWNVIPPFAIVAVGTLLDKVVTYPGFSFPIIRTLFIGFLYITEVSGILNGLKQRGYDVPRQLKSIISYWKGGKKGD